MNKRVPVNELTKLLNNINFNIKRDIFFWNEFYNFVLMSYKTPIDSRYSISLLGKYLKNNNVEDRKEIIECYIHTMNILAKLEGSNLYGNGFYI